MTGMAFLTHAVRPYGAIFSRLARNQANSNKFHIMFFLMNLILFGGFLSAGYYMGRSVGWVISVIPQSCGMERK
jgi:hypothetical protein